MSLELEPSTPALEQSFLGASISVQPKHCFRLCNSFCYEINAVRLPFRLAGRNAIIKHLYGCSRLRHERTLHHPDSQQADCNRRYLFAISVTNSEGISLAWSYATLLGQKGRVSRHYTRSNTFKAGLSQRQAVPELGYGMPRAFVRNSDTSAHRCCEDSFDCLP